MIDYGLTFLTGLLTSLHCVGMCGMIVLAYSAQPSNRVSKLADIALHSAYNIGRIGGYILVGVIVGMLGMTLSWLKDAGEYLSIVSGVIMIISGFALLGWIPLSPMLSLFGANSTVTKLHAGLLRKKSFASKLTLGLLTPLLPCGMLYAMIAKAASTGNIAASATTMGVFGLGMAPALFLLGSLSALFSARIRKHGEQIAALLIILMGIVLILRGFHIPFLSWMSNEPKCPKCAS